MLLGNSKQIARASYAALLKIRRILVVHTRVERVLVHSDLEREALVLHVLNLDIVNIDYVLLVQILYEVDALERLLLLQRSLLFLDVLPVGLVLVFVR